MQEYKDLIEHTYKHGEIYQTDRTKTGMILSSRPFICTFDLNEGFPIVSLKKTNFDAIKAELGWFLSGSTNINDLPKKYRFMWKNWADNNGHIGPLYGYQLQYYNQINNCIRSIIQNPFSRAHLMTTWNPQDHSYCFSYEKPNYLVPCHGQMIHFTVSPDEQYLDLHCVQRSPDIGIGVPFNWASYALLLHLFANETSLRPRYLHYTLSVPHMYLNHVNKLRSLLDLNIKEKPILIAHPKHATIHSFTKTQGKLTEDILQLYNYKPYPYLKLDIAI